MIDLFTKTRDYIVTSFKNNPPQIRHFDLTVAWVKKLRPNADDALLIAAVGHDIERAFRTKNEGFNNKDIPYTDPATLKHHQEKGAELLSAFLKENGASDELIARVKHLVSQHEVGGDTDQNLLKDADSLSFLENNGPTFIGRLSEHGYAKIREKIDWMYDRISDPKAKALAEPFYTKLRHDLDEQAGVGSGTP